MKKIPITLLLTIPFLCFVGCGYTEEPAGVGDPEITGSIAYFYGDAEDAIEVFYSTDNAKKEIVLSKNKTYKIELRPSFRGSKSVLYIGDCAEFGFDGECCEINYIGDSDSRPTYELTVTADKGFVLTVEVDGYTQRINVVVE